MTQAVTMIARPSPDRSVARVSGAGRHQTPITTWADLSPAARAWRRVPADAPADTLEPFPAEGDRLEGQGMSAGGVSG